MKPPKKDFTLVEELYNRNIFFVRNLPKFLWDMTKQNEGNCY